MRYVFYANDYGLFPATYSLYRRVSVRKFRDFSESSSDSFPNMEK